MESDLIIIMFGINEVITIPRIGIDNYEQSFDKIISELKANKKEVLVLSPTPIHIMDRALEKYSKIVFDLAKKHDVYILNMRSLIAEYIKEHNLKKYNIIGIDNVHFWSNKYKIISEIVFKNFLT